MLFAADGSFHNCQQFKMISKRVRKPSRSLTIFLLIDIIIIFSIAPFPELPRGFKLVKLKKAPKIETNYFEYALYNILEDCKRKPVNLIRILQMRC